ncbi:MAG: rhamnulokinase [Clostridia bacterium]|nr:rhamnulokinase [Clostridia bacterium]
MQYHLAIDIGASSGRHILAWLEEGKMQTQEIYRFSNQPTEIDGSLFWDTDRLFQEIVNGLKRAKELGKIPVSVGVDTWGVDYVLLDKEDKPLRKTYCYRDSRTERTINKVHQIIPFGELFAKTGIQFAAFNTIYQLYDDKEKGLLDKAESLLMLPDYFHFRLTGVKKQEYTNATTTGLVDSSTRTWSGEILKKLGYKASLFTPLTAPSSAVGELSKEVREIVGYNAQVILPATHDTASAVLAAPIFDNSPYISSGTWSLLGVEQPLALTSDTAKELGYSNEGSVHGNYRLQKNIMGLWIIQQFRKELEKEYSFAELADMARNSPVPEVFDVNDGRFFAPKSMKEEIYSAIGKTLSVGETAHCIYQSLAISYDKSIRDLQQITGKKYDTLHIIGGGSQNTFLNELTKEKTGKRIITGPAEGTAIGNLIMQMVGAGACASVLEGRKIVKNSFDIKEV